MRLTTVFLAAGMVVGAAGPAPAAGLTPLLLVHETYDPIIERAFRAVLNRAPSDYELRRYRTLMEADNWTEADVRRDLRERSDYRGLRLRRGMTAEAIVQHAYREILGRDPDPNGLRNYTGKIMNEGWSEWDVRNALRNSDEYAAGAALRVRTAAADRIIRHAYQEILGREPDPAGLETYRRNILEEGWDEYDVRRALIRSPERRQQRLGLRHRRLRRDGAGRGGGRARPHRARVAAAHATATRCRRRARRLTPGHPVSASPGTRRYRAARARRRPRSSRRTSPWRCSSPSRPRRARG